MSISISPLRVDTTALEAPAKTADAAHQFEGMMIAQMLRDARASSKLDADEDSSAETSTVMDMADQQFAQLLAKQGGIGLGQLAAAGLNKSS